MEAFNDPKALFHSQARENVMQTRMDEMEETNTVIENDGDSD